MNITNRYCQAGTACGFTLVEMMITIAVVGVLIAIALPSYSESPRARRMTTDTNKIVSDVELTQGKTIDASATEYLSEH